jgi:hypothetical protein
LVRTKFNNTKNATGGEFNNTIKCSRWGSNPRAWKHILFNLRQTKGMLDCSWDYIIQIILSRLYNLHVDIWQTRLLKLELFFLDILRQQVQSWSEQNLITQKSATSGEFNNTIKCSQRGSNPQAWKYILFNLRQTKDMFDCSWDYILHIILSRLYNLHVDV